MTLPASSSSHGSILVVDDDELICSMIQGILEEDGYAITTVNSLAEARNRISKEGYNGFLVDYKLPDGNGLDFIRHMRQKEVKEPVILVTGFASSDLAHECQPLQIFDLIPKPFSIDQLREVVARAVTPGKKSVSPAPEIPQPLPNPITERIIEVSPVKEGETQLFSKKNLLLLLAAACLVLGGLLTYWLLKL